MVRHVGLSQSLWQSMLPSGHAGRSNRWRATEPEFTRLIPTRRLAELMVSEWAIFLFWYRFMLSAFFKGFAGSAAVAFFAHATPAAAQTGQPGLSAEVREKISAHGASRQQKPGIQSSQAAIDSVATCRKLIADEMRELEKTLTANRQSAARWQAAGAALAAALKFEDVASALDGVGLPPADVVKLKELKDLDKLRAHVATEREKLLPETAAATFKKRIDVTCSTILEGINAHVKVTEAQVRAEMGDLICRQKVDALAAYLDYRFGEAGTATGSVQNGLTILGAVFGEFSERLVCDATTYLRQGCEDGRTATKKTAGASFCMIDRLQNVAATDFCGYDPAPRDEKKLIIRYSCGGRERRALRLPAATKHIRLVCAYPDPPDPVRLTEPELARIKAFLIAQPCAIDKSSLD